LTVLHEERKNINSKRLKAKTIREKKIEWVKKIKVATITELVMIEDKTPKNSFGMESALSVEYRPFAWNEVTMRIPQSMNIKRYSLPSGKINPFSM